MRFAHNLERHPTVKGAYIIYDAQGFAFRATGYSGNWMARHLLRIMRKAKRNRLAMQGALVS